MSRHGLGRSVAALLGLVCVHCGAEGLDGTVLPDVGGDAGTPSAADPAHGERHHPARGRAWMQGGFGTLADIDAVADRVTYIDRGHQLEVNVEKDLPDGRMALVVVRIGGGLDQPALVPGAEADVGRSRRVGERLFLEVLGCVTRPGSSHFEYDESADDVHILSEHGAPAGTRSLLLTARWDADGRAVQVRVPAPLALASDRWHTLDVVAAAISADDAELIASTAAPDKATAYGDEGYTHVRLSTGAERLDLVVDSLFRWGAGAVVTTPATQAGGSGAWLRITRGDGSVLVPDETRLAWTLPADGARRVTVEGRFHLRGPAGELQDAFRAVRVRFELLPVAR